MSAPPSRGTACRRKTDPIGHTTNNLRYVVLHHTGHGEAHFDLMLETEPERALWTFRAPDWPIRSRVELAPLPDHRRAYLEYEGPVSGGRGQVRRVEAGRLADSSLNRDDGDILLRLEAHERNGAPTSPREAAALRLSRDEAGRWWIERLARAKQAPA